MNSCSSPLSCISGSTGMQASMASLNSTSRARLCRHRNRVVTGTTIICICVRSYLSSSASYPASGSPSYQMAQSCRSKITSEIGPKYVSKSAGWQEKYTRGFPCGPEPPLVL